MSVFIKALHKWLEILSSLKLTFLCLLGLLALVFFGTLDQVNLGIYMTQKKYFHSVFVYLPLGSMRIPVFPGGLLIGTLLVLNLSVVTIKRRFFQRKKWGLLLIHVGLLLLLLGGGLTSLVGVETRVSIEEGETKRYAESLRQLELVFIRRDVNEDRVFSVPLSLIEKIGQFEHPDLPFSLHTRAFVRNAALSSGVKKGAALPSATQGLGVGLQVVGIPPTFQDDQLNAETIVVDVVDKASHVVGRWLFSRQIHDLQRIEIDGDTYNAILRPTRQYFSFDITLKKFSHDRYPGTTIPKNFSSLVQIDDLESNTSRSFLIYMNHPLRYQGYAFYQASFGENSIGEADRLSILQVVKNPSWLMPYISSALISLGLCWYFLERLIWFIRRRAR